MQKIIFFLLSLTTMLPIIAMDPEKRQQKFFDAIKAGDVELVKDAIVDGIDINALNANKDTPLLAALKKSWNNETGGADDKTTQANIEIITDIVNEIPNTDIKNLGTTAETLVTGNIKNDTIRKLVNKAIDWFALYNQMISTKPDIDKIKKSLKTIPTVNNSPNQDRSLFAIAIEKKLGADIVAELIWRDANVMQTFEKGATPLKIAQTAGDDGVTALLIKKIKETKDKSPEEIDRQKNFFEAIKDTKIDAVKKLIAEGIDIDARNDYGDTPLQAAIRALKNAPDQLGIDIVSVIVNETPNTNIRTWVGSALASTMTILNTNNQLAIAPILEKAESWYNLYREIAADVPDESAIKSAFSRVGTVNNSSDPNRNLLALAIKKNLGIDIIEELIKMGADPKQILSNKLTPLQIAENEGRSDIVELVAGKKPTAPKTPAEQFFAAIRNHKPHEAWSFIEKNLVSVDEKDKDGDTALIVAIKANEGILVFNLLNLGADPELAGGDGKTPLTVATGNSPIITILQEKINERKILETPGDDKQLLSSLHSLTQSLSALQAKLTLK